MVKWTFVFIIACIVVFFLQITEIFDWRYFAFTPDLAFDMPWTFITSIFLHADFGHLLFNMIVLFFLGMFLESRIGSKNFLIIFFLAGVGGSLGYMITASGSLTPAVGASGAIYGILGALAVIMPFAMVWLWGLVPMPMIAVAFLWGIMDFFGLFGGGSIAHGAHLGGLFVGLACGWYLKKTVRKRYRRIMREVYR